MESYTADGKIICPKCGTQNNNWLSRCEKCGGKFHKNQNEIPNFEPRGAAFWMAFILGIVGSGFLGYLAFWDSLDYWFFGLLLVSLIGLILCWKWPLVAGITLIIAGILPIIVGLAMSSSSDIGFLPGLVMLGISVIPLLVSGIIFISTK